MLILPGVNWVAIPQKNPKQLGTLYLPFSCESPLPSPSSGTFSKACGFRKWICVKQNFPNIFSPKISTPIFSKQFPPKFDTIPKMFPPKNDVVFPTKNKTHPPIFSSKKILSSPPALSNSTSKLRVTISGLKASALNEFGLMLSTQLLHTKLRWGTSEWLEGPQRQMWVLVARQLSVPGKSQCKLGYDVGK